MVVNSTSISTAEVPDNKLDLELKCTVEPSGQDAIHFVQWYAVDESLAMTQLNAGEVVSSLLVSDLNIDLYGKEVRAL